MARRHVLSTDSLASIFGRLEELVLANSGEDEFEEIFKLLIAKLWDEREPAKKNRRFSAGAAQALLDEAARAWPAIFDGARPRIRLARPHLAVCAEIFSAVELGAKGGEALDAIFEFLTVRSAKGRKGQFFTPRHVVDFCVRLVAPRAGEVIVDPACGSGAFLSRAISKLPKNSRKRVFGFDFDPRAVRIARAMMLVAGDGSARVERLNSLTRRSKRKIEKIIPENGADIILTNPPFAGEVREPALLASYRFGRGRARVERDVLFVERCVELLKPGGRLAIVLPDNKFSSDAHAELRRFLLDELRVVAVVGLGRKTFLPHTSQKASVLFAERRGARKKTRGDEAIFFAVSERDGKSAAGELLRGAGGRVDHDLDEIAAAFEREVGAGEGPWRSGR